MVYEDPAESTDAAEFYIRLAYLAPGVLMCYGNLPCGRHSPQKASDDMHMSLFSGARPESVDLLKINLMVPYQEGPRLCWLTFVFASFC